MTNPNNAIGTNAAYSGRTSPDALNDILGSFSAGIASGWACSPKSGMTVQLGGVAGTRDVALAEDNNGNKLTINNRSGAPVEVTLTGAPVTNNRIDCIVAYVDNPSTGDGSTTDNPSTCGIIAVSGTVAANPTAPSDATIRSAITTDGATGGSAYYVVLASILVGTGVTTIGSGVITQGATSVTDNFEIADGSISTAKIADGSIGTAKIADSAVTSTKIDWTTVAPRIIQAGQISVGSVGANTEKRGIVAIPTQDDTDFTVIYSHAADVSGYNNCVPTTRTANKTTSQFQWNVYNSGSASGNIVLGYIVVKY